MGLLGKYTTYVGGVATDAHKLLAKLFPASPFATPLTAGDEKAAQKMIVDVATAKVDASGVGGLQPSDGVQQGDLGMFPTGVPLGFGASPDVSSVKWTNAGDPANPYFPDITSPGPGKTDGKDKTTDPGLKTSDVPHTDSDTAGQDLRNPTKDGPAIYGNNTLGAPQKLGDSGGNV
jgi:hypothetical protein